MERGWGVSYLPAGLMYPVHGPNWMMSWVLSPHLAISRWGVQDTLGRQRALLTQATAHAPY